MKDRIMVTLNTMFAAYNDKLGLIKFDAKTISQICSSKAQSEILSNGGIYLVTRIDKNGKEMNDEEYDSTCQLISTCNPGSINQAIESVYGDKFGIVKEMDIEKETVNVEIPKELYEPLLNYLEKCNPAINAGAAIFIMKLEIDSKDGDTYRVLSEEDNLTYIKYMRLI